MKILIVNRFFGGAQIPTGRMAEDVARVLVEQGHEVVALASSGTYAGAVAQALDYRTTGRQDDPPTRSALQPAPAGQGALMVETVRVPKWMPRALAWVWFTWQVRKRIPRLNWDVCVLMTDPPLLPLLTARVKAAEGPRDYGTTGPQDATRRVAIWLMDIYPEALAASGRITKSNPLYRWYFEKRQRALSAADLLICLGDQQRTLLGEALTKEVRAAVVPPWDDRGNIALATEESLRNLVLYAGNLGEAHCFEEILAAAPHLPGDWTIRFAARGAKLSALKENAKGISHRLTRIDTDGSDRHAPPGRGEKLVPDDLGTRNSPSDKEAAEPESEGVFSHSRPQGTGGAAGDSPKANGPKASHGWKKMDTDTFSAGDTGEKSLPPENSAGSGAAVHVTGYASEEETPALLASARVHLITMSPGWEGIVVPSKLYGCIRTGRPVLFIGPENADTAREIRAHGWGKVLPPGASGEEVARAILELAARPTRATESRDGAREVAKLIETLATD